MRDIARADANAHLPGMETIAPDTLGRQEQQVRDMLARHPLHASVTGYDVRFDDTWDGEPAIWVLLHQPGGNQRATAETIRQMSALRTDIIAALRSIAPDREAFARFVLPPGSAAG